MNDGEENHRIVLKGRESYITLMMLFGLFRGRSVVDSLPLFPLVPLTLFPSTLFPSTLFPPATFVSSTDTFERSGNGCKLVVPSVVVLIVVLRGCVVKCVVALGFTSTSLSILGGLGRARPEACRMSPGGRNSPDGDLEREAV